MTEPEFDRPAEDEQEVRDLLAALGRTPESSDTAAEPLPDDVAHRLDTLLGELADERARGVTSVVPLDQRRRRHLSRSRSWLAAAGIAAAVVLATVIAPAMLADDPAPTAENLTAAESVESPEQTPSSAPLTGTPVLRTATLQADVVDLLHSLDSLPTPRPRTSSGRGAADEPSTEEPSAEELDLVPLTSGAAGTCTWDGRGTAYEVTLDDRRALAVVTGRPGTDRLVRLLVCALGTDPTEVATVQVPAP